MHILILGGGVFLGVATLTAALARGHRVTVFNRGRARSAWPQGVEAITGDRGTDLHQLEARQWDAVIDTCGYTPAEVRSSCDALRGCGRYLFVSSISVYATTHQVPVRETDPLARFEAIAADDRDMQHYGPQKAACEAEVSRVFGERALLVRPGLIVGPGDRSGRFSYWPWRVMGSGVMGSGEIGSGEIGNGETGSDGTAGSEMLVPDVPAHEPLQFIDVRDLGEWLVLLLERGASGAINATGPVGDGSTGACNWPTLLATCAQQAHARGIAPASAVPVSEAFLIDQKVAPWSELPLWLPSTDPEYRGFNRVDLTRAAAAGLRTRALRETVAAVMDEGVPEAADARHKGKLTRERERSLIDAVRLA